ncbi:hypothetical protein HanIR_Chr10g0491181 [Helianthus annuus]|nr:hypothetical protein HanIR_Chr10g0491181 [Helianthus annuus]
MLLVLFVFLMYSLSYFLLNFVSLFFLKLVIYVLNDLLFVFSHGESSIFFEIRTRNVRLPKQLWILKTTLQSFLKLIDDYDPIFLEIPYDFASLLWGGKVPYGHCLELIDDDLCNCRSLNLLRTQEVSLILSFFWCFLIQYNDSFHRLC